MNIGKVYVEQCSLPQVWANRRLGESSPRCDLRPNGYSGDRRRKACLVRAAKVSEGTEANEYAIAIRLMGIPNHAPSVVPQA